MAVKQVTCFGEVLWDNLPSGTKIGGAPLNVAYHLQKNGMDSLLITQVGADAKGYAIIDELQLMQVDSSYCGISPSYPTSEVDVFFNDNEEISYAIKENVAWDHIAYNPDIEIKIADSSVFIYGTLSSRSPHTARTLRKYLASCQWNILDLNLRTPYYNKSTLLELISSCDSLKLNMDELTILHTLFFNDDNHFSLKVINSIFDKFKRLNEVIITNGADGAFYYSRTTSLEFNTIQVKVRDTVGCGDAFLAGFVKAKLANLEIEECVKEALLLSAFVATKNSGTPSYGLMEYAAFKKVNYPLLLSRLMI